ncbi:hypothetical protein L1049_005486 [Liquidambar formosana]|uniref:Phosphoglycolate phosphatase n=1 Tax=Liquidambar formosana TaxID=63359 RepID=A0AAP0X1V3_LIQFO
MAEYMAIPSYAKLHMQRSCIKQRGLRSSSHFRIVQRKYSYGSCKIIWLPTQEVYKPSSPGITNLKLSSCLRGSSLRLSCLRTLVNPDSATSDWVAVVDQVLLMASVLLTYMAGVLPSEKSSFHSRTSSSDENVVPGSSTVSGSAMKNDEQVDLKYAWDVVKGKLMDALNAIEQGGDVGNRVIEFEQNRAKRPLSLYAVAEGPRLRLLWASLQQLEEEVNNISANSEIVNMDDRLAIFSEIIQKSRLSVCMTWLEKELCLKNNKPDKALLSSIFEKLKGDSTILQNIRKSGKEDLYSELLCFLRFNYLSEGRCYDHSLFTLHGVAILEDLVITLADGIASIYLELISVDGNMSNEMNGLGLILCTLSTRELQRLRNEVALNQWLHQNMEAVISMYEDRFDLCTLQTQLIEEPSRSQTEEFNWWKKLTLRKSVVVLSTFSYVVISHFSMPVKRIKELRVLTGWRYYFSLFLELSDITMPLIRAVFAKVSNAISFFLVCLIGRSLGLIYTGIRQSLRWK